MGLSDYIPTDNLYKFIAISGLIICGFSLAVPYKTLNEYNLESNKISTQLSILKLESQYLTEDADNLKAEDKRLSKDVEEFKKEIEKKEEQTKEFTEKQKNYYKGIVLEMKKESNLIIKTAKQIIERNRSIGIKLEEIKGKQKINDYLIKRIKEYKVFFSLTMIIGLIMESVGFFLWYTRLQVYQDKRVQDEKQEKN